MSAFLGYKLITEVGNTDIWAPPAGLKLFKGGPRKAGRAHHRMCPAGCESWAPPESIVAPKYLAVHVLKMVSYN